MRPYQRKLNRFRKLSRELNELLRSGEFFRLSSTHRQRLVDQLKELFYRLIHVFSEFRLKKILAGAAILIGLGATHTATAQTFGAPQLHSFGIQSNQSIINFAFADLDIDGDDDLLMVNSNGQFLFQENIGTPQSPAFSTPVPNPFNLAGNSPYGQLVELVDLDNDGDFDLVVMEYYNGDMLYFENIGTPQAADFASLVTNPHGFSPPNYNYFIPAFADMDDDGDLDLLMGGITYYGNILYFENTGTPQQPAWGAAQNNPFGVSLPANAYVISPTIADLDMDGDSDLLMGTYIYGAYGSYSTEFYYHENTGTPLAADWSGAPQQNPFNLTVPLTGNVVVILPKFVDIDNDGDMDVVALSYDYNQGVGIYYYENQSILPGISPSPQATGFTVSPIPASGQVTIQLNRFNDDPMPVTLFNHLGQMVLKQMLTEQVSQVSLVGMPAGAYTIKVGDQHQVVVVH